MLFSDLEKEDFVSDLCTWLRQVTMSHNSMFVPFRHVFFLLAVFTARKSKFHRLNVNIHLKRAPLKACLHSSLNHKPLPHRSLLELKSGLTAQTFFMHDAQIFTEGFLLLFSLYLIKFSSPAYIPDISKEIPCKWGISVHMSCVLRCHSTLT